MRSQTMHRREYYFMLHPIELFCEIKSMSENCICLCSQVEGKGEVERLLLRV